MFETQTRHTAETMSCETKMKNILKRFSQGHIKAVKTRRAPAARAVRISIKSKTFVIVPFHLNITLTINLCCLFTHTHTSEWAQKVINSTYQL